MPKTPQFNGQALTQFELQLPKQQPFTLTPNLVTYQSSVLKENVYGVKEYIHKFSTMLPEFVNDLIRSAMVDGTPRFRFRLGLGQPNKTTWLPWQEHYITYYGAVTEGISRSAGHTLEIATSDAFYAIGRVNKTTVRKGTISEILQRIADENKLQAVIEPTTERYLYIQNYLDDIAFVRQRLLHRAVNKKGRGNYYFFIRDNVLHFHTADYQSEIKQIIYYDSPHVSLAQADRSQQLWDEGVSGVRMIVYDPYTGETKEITSEPDKSLRFANGIYQLKNVTGGQLNTFYHLGANRPQEATGIGQSTYEQARQNTFEIKATFDKLITVRPGDILDLVVSQQVSKTSPWSGLYYVCGVNTAIIQNAVTASLTIKRGEIHQDASNVVTQVANRQLIPEAEAPGQDINNPEIQSSSQTKGAGKQQSTTTFSTVVDANTVVDD